MMYSADSKRCECSQFTFFCEDQAKCIPKDHCCSIKDCNPRGGSPNKCIPTIYKLEVCVAIGTTKMCTYLDEYRKSRYTLTDVQQKFSEDVFVSARPFESDVADIEFVRGNSTRLLEKVAVNSEEVVDNLKIALIGITEYGGLCKDSGD
jgi:hypothetical protein